jgi:hypothetical protein
VSPKCGEFTLDELRLVARRFGGVGGSAYFIGGFAMTALTANNTVLVPIRSGLGLRLGANIGYLEIHAAVDLEPVLTAVALPRQILARLRLRPTSGIEYLAHRRWHGSAYRRIPIVKSLLFAKSVLGSLRGHRHSKALTVSYSADNRAETSPEASSALLPARDVA